MTRHGIRMPARSRPLVALTGVLALGASLLVAGSAEATPPANTGIVWQDCPDYSDAVLRSFGVPPDKLPEGRALWNRMECGTVSVPLDYANPKGRRISVALSRLPATDRAHRLGALALNPGGPGASGYAIALNLLLGASDQAALLNDRYDLIGFDPRGVGRSTKVDCPSGEDLAAKADSPPPTTITEADARARYAASVAQAKACGQFDPAFLRQITTANVARDLDRIRAGLGERKLNFLGISWGTWLGVVYRELFGGNVGRMFLDSQAPPVFVGTDFDDQRAAATERNANRFAAWAARFDSTLHLGSTPARVRSTLAAMVRRFDADPIQFDGLRGPIDGRVISQIAMEPQPNWARTSTALALLKDATDGPAPAYLADFLKDDGEGTPPPADAPEPFNETMHQAAFCNEDPDRPTFEAAWTAYQRRVAAAPITGRMLRFTAGCAGWPLPAQITTLHRSSAPLVISGHRWETLSVYAWSPQTRAIAGGQLFTVRDDLHGSVLRSEDCSADLVGYFATGRIDRGCAGIPASTEPESPTA